MNRIEWKGFKPGSWQTCIDVGSFIRKNYTPYDEDASFLSEPTEKTTALWNICKELLNIEIKKGGVLDIDTGTVSRITGYPAGYINRDLEVIVGLQTDAPLKTRHISKWRNTHGRKIM